MICNLPDARHQKKEINIIHIGVATSTSNRNIVATYLQSNFTRVFNTNKPINITGVQKFKICWLSIYIGIGIYLLKSNITWLFYTNKLRQKQLECTSKNANISKY